MAPSRTVHSPSRMRCAALSCARIEGLRSYGVTGLVGAEISVAISLFD